ncbi:MAG: outer membrane protein assembly factor BamD [Burkholderiales bacterium]|nr:outer membrane protein assembly factor BamD [Burkholderiales bacterium]
MTNQRSLIQRILTVFLALAVSGLLGGCGIFGKDVDETRGWSVQKLYAEARSELADRNWENAIKHYERIESRYPFGRFAQQAQIEAAYAHWKNEDTASALAAIDRFVKLHPNHPSADYMYFLRGLINFNDDLGIMGFFSGQDLSERDPKAAAEAFAAFKELAVRFPESKYTPDAIQRMNYLVNALASHEIHVARYYLKRKAYVAAANRAQYALKTYPGAPANEEGLVVMVKAYDALGLTTLRDDAERVLNRNFPDSVYLKGGPRGGVLWWQIWNW